MKTIQRKIIDFFITKNNEQFYNMVDMMGLNSIYVRNISQFIKILDSIDNKLPFRIWVNIDVRETPQDIFINTRHGKFLKERFTGIKFQYLSLYPDNLKDIDGQSVYRITEIFKMMNDESLLNNAVNFDEKTPKIFISYSWDNEKHKEWVLTLANTLLKNGIEIVFDQYDLTLGKSIHHFMEHNIKQVDCVVVVYSKKYKEKAEGRIGGVGYEYSILNNHLFKNQTNNLKILPILKSGSPETSIPDFMQQFLYLDMRNSKKFDDKLLELVKQIFNKQSSVSKRK